MRYRVQFIAEFYREIEATDDGAARRGAEFLASTEDLPPGGKCRWNIMQRLADAGDDD